jgi:hypothetical protein
MVKWFGILTANNIDPVLTEVEDDATEEAEA